MRRSVKDYCRACVPCQRAKIVRHVKAPLQSYADPSARFASLNLDLVGPLPAAEGFTYLMTVIDRFSRWTEAIPLLDITAQACAKALVRHWVSRFGVPAHLVTDQGRQFTSNLWRELMILMGTDHAMTTAYHPQSNGLIERFHRTLKERLMARAQSSGTGTWMDHLPFVLLGVRTAVREDSGCSPAELLYGESLRLPSDLLSSPSFGSTPALADFASDLRGIMRANAPMPFDYHGSPPERVPASLASCSHIFLRVDAVRRPLSPPYEGPFRVLERGPKTFVIDRAGKSVTVTVDRLKPASLLDPPSSAVPATPTVPAVNPPAAARPLGDQDLATVPDSASSRPVLDPEEWPLPTRSGRIPRPVHRYGV